MSAPEHVILARRYRLLLLAYPSGYRDRRGEELLGTLLDDASPDQRWPSGREAASIAAQGLRARLDAGRHRTTGASWSEGLHMGALLLLGYAGAGLVTNLTWVPLSVPIGSALLLGLAGTLAAVRGRPIIALALTAAWLTVPLLQDGWLSWPLATAVVALAIVAARFPSPRSVRSSGWLLVAPVVVSIEFGPYLVTDDPAVVGGLVASITIAGVLIAGGMGVALDPRIPIAIGCLAVAVGLDNTVGVQPFTDHAGSGPRVVFHPLPVTYVVAILVAVLFLAGHLRSRQLARL